MSKIQSNNANLYYEVHGKGQPLLFIHGLGSSTPDWELQVKEFSKTYQVITFDLRGHGQSDKPAGPYSLPMFASDAATVLKSLGIGSAHVVGLSLGGCIAFQLVTDLPSLVKTMTIVNSGPEVVIRTFKDRMGVWQRFTVVRLFGMRKIGEILSKNLFPREENASLRKTFVENWAKNDSRAYLTAMRAMVNWTVMDKLGSINCPTLILTADQDYTPVSFKEGYIKRIPNAQLVVIPDAHHGLPAEWPEKFNAVLMDFLVKHS
ncbi:MAG: alpha/beta hydrolase [Chloroflexi bacterium]|nr:alpha/beta hydrolase [Chloroflexota bacterium]